MNELKVFQNDQFGAVRVIPRDGEPWFVAVDVCRVLEIGNSRMATERLDKDEKGVSTIDTPGGRQEMTIINEPGLYDLIFCSRKPEAKAFKRWITHEVIPSIRKHGAYATDAVIDQIIADPKYGIRLLEAFQAEKDKNAELTTINAIQAQQLEEAQPKVNYYDKVLKSSGLVKTSVIASDYGVSAVKFNRILADLKVQFKQGNIWLLYDKYKHEGYTQTDTYYYQDKKTGETKANCWMKWTQKGRLFLYELLKANGYLPICEQAA